MNGIVERTGVAVSRIDAEGVWTHATDEVVLDVLFDGRRIWSFWLLRDSRPVDADEGGATHLARWPKSLGKYLDGHARIVVREHVSEVVLFDEDVRFGDGEDGIEIVDDEGRPLATDKTGELHRVFACGDPGDREALLDTIEDVIGALSEIGVRAFPAYGTLLGAVRDQKLIGHDSDADLSYVSSYTTPVDLILESYRIDRHLRSHGYSVQRHSAFAMKIYVEEADGSERGLDVFGGAFVDGRLYVMGEIGIEFSHDQVYPLGTCTLEGRTLPAPADAEAWLEVTYGPNWRVPDPAFHFAPPLSTRRRLDGWFRGTRRHRDDWDRVWMHHGYLAGAGDDEPQVKPNRFARWVHRQEPDADVVVDVGSGSGDDVLWYAEQGVRAIGLDYAHSALQSAQHWAEHRGSGAEFEMVNLCDMRSVLSTGAWLAQLPGKRVLTARLLVCSLDQRVRLNFWRLCSMAARDGSKVYLQVVDPERRGRGHKRLLRPAPTTGVVDDIENAGGRILEQYVIEPEDSGDGARYTRMVVTWERYASASAA